MCEGCVNGFIQVENFGGMQACNIVSIISLIDLLCISFGLFLMSNLIRRVSKQNKIF